MGIKKKAFYSFETFDMRMKKYFYRICKKYKLNVTLAPVTEYAFPLKSSKNIYY